MKTLIISYSLTGNNAILAKGISERIGADWVEIRERKKRNVMTIILDVIFNRTPPVNKVGVDLSSYENLVFVAPVWLGKIASPLRKLFRELHGIVNNYFLVSISAGADGENPALEKDVTARLGKKPEEIINPLISDILPPEPKPGRKELDAYRLSGREADEIINRVSSRLSGCIEKNA